MKRTFSPLKVANYRLYFAGQAVSLVGTWMQTVAQAWLVLTLTHSGAMLGVVSAAQLLPVLLLGPYAGAVADRVSKRSCCSTATPLRACSRSYSGSCA